MAIVPGRLLDLVSVQLVDYFRDPGSSFSELRDALRPPGQPSGCETILTRAVGRGERADAPRAARVVNLPFELLRHDVFMTMRAVPGEPVTEIVDAVWLPLLGVADRATGR